MPLSIAGERVVVTGSTGFIGSALVARLRVHNDVHVLVRDTTVAQSRLHLPSEQVHSTRNPADSIAATLKRVSPTLVFHLATHYERHDDATKIAAMVDANVRFGSLVLDAASYHPECDVVVTGSHFQFAGQPRTSANFYAATKNALCEIARYLQQVRGLRWVQTVLFDVYGPNDTRPKLINLLLERVRTGQSISLPDPEPLHHFVYIDDAIDALVASAHELRVGDATIGHDVFVTSNELVTPSAVLEVVSSCLGNRPVVNNQPLEMPSRSIMIPFDGPRPKNWQPRIGIREGIQSILDESPGEA